MQEVLMKKHQSRRRSKQEATPDLFPADSNGEAGVGYEMLPSVWEGDDAALLERMLAFYPRKAPKLILDATVNRGRFWEGSGRPVIGLDIDPRYKPDVVADHTLMPFGDGVFDVVVYDPPHIPNQGKDRRKDFRARFGLGGKSPSTNGYNFTHCTRPSSRKRTASSSRKGFCSARSPTTFTTTASSGRTSNWSGRRSRPGFSPATASSRCGKTLLWTRNGRKPTTRGGTIATGWCSANPRSVSKLLSQDGFRYRMTL
jgi:hypothetical protein